jgi:hypothetical protein
LAALADVDHLGGCQGCWRLGGRLKLAVPGRYRCGVVIAVLGMSSGFTGIWWYPFFRSILEKIVQQAALVTKSIMFGMGYVSGMVTALRQR